MQVSPLDSAPGARAASAGAANAGAATSEGAFAKALGDQARRAAARDLLAAMPAPIAYQILHGAPGGGPPVPGLHEMVQAVQDGSFVPGERELRSPFWRALDGAAQAFESPEAMWATMREVLGAREEIEAAVAAAAGSAATPESSGPAAPASGGDAFEALGGALPAWQLEWWQWTLEHVLREAGERA